MSEIPITSAPTRDPNEPRKNPIPTIIAVMLILVGVILFFIITDIIPMITAGASYSYYVSSFFFVGIPSIIAGLFILYKQGYLSLFQ